MTAMHISLPFVLHYEGFRSKPYQDEGGTWTVGYGETGWNSRRVTETYPEEVKEPEARSHVVSRLKSIENVVLNAAEWVNEEQLAALSSLIYNIGSGPLRFESRLKVALKNIDVPSAALGIIRYCHVRDGEYHRVDKGLLIRRIEEAKLFLGEHSRRQ